MIDLKDLHIVIAEDDIDDGRVISESFSKHPSYKKIDWVKNGKELLDFLNNHHDNLPDIILTDINMPIVNGIEAIEEIFQNSILSKIPIFVYTSTVNPSYESKCKSMGTKAFLIKPFTLAEFDEIPYQLIYILKGSISNVL